MAYPYDDQDDQYEDTASAQREPDLAAEPAPQQTYTLAAAPAALPNPVLREFTPAPVVAPAAPASALAAPTQSTVQAATAPTGEAPDTFEPAPAATGRPPVTEETARNNQALLDDYFAREKAALQTHKAAGGQTERLFTGAEVIKRADDGNDLYHEAVTKPFERLDDGHGYRVSRDQWGAEHYFKLSDGQEGSDYHTDPQTGEKYVATAGADGTSKREVIGQDALIPRINDAKQQAQQHNQTVQQTALTIAQAENGTQGGGPMAAASLGDLRGEATTITRDLKPLQKQLADISSYTPDGEQGVDAADLTAKKQIADQIKFKTDRLGVVQQEIDGRDSIIADARQQRDTATQGRLTAGMQAHMYSQVRRLGGLAPVQSDLETIASGGALSEDRARALASVGLLKEEPAEGGTVMRVTPAATSLLSDKTRQAIAGDPSKFVVSAGPSPAHVTHAASQLAQAQTASTSTDQPQGPKLYAVKNGKLSFDSTQPATAGVTQAISDGALDPATGAQTLALAKQADAQRAELEKAAGGSQQFKALLAGVAPGVGFMAAGTAAAAVGNLGPNEAIAGATGPFFPLTMGVLNAAEFIGGGIFGSRATKALQEKLGQYSETVASLNASAKLHPGWEAAGEMIPAIPSAVGSLRNLAGIGRIAATDLGEAATVGEQATAAAKAVGKKVAPAALGGAAAEGVIRPVVESGVNKVEDQFGIQHEDVQAPTLGSITQMAALGGLLAGHGGVDFRDYSPNQMASILSRGMAHMGANVPMDAVVPPESMAAKFGNNPNVNNQSLVEWAKPLTPAENEIFFKAHARLNQLSAEGKIDRSQPFEGSARQATRAGQPMDSTALEFRQIDSQEAPVEGTPSRDPSLSLGGQTPASRDNSRSPAPSPVAPASHSGGSLDASQPTPEISSASPVATAPVAAGQASAADDDLRQRIADTQTALDAGKVAPEARETTQALLDHLRGQLAQSSAGAVTDVQASSEATSKPTVTRAGGKSTVTLGEKTVTVPSVEEWETVQMMRSEARRAARNQAPAGVEQPGKAPTPLEPFAPSAKDSTGAELAVGDTVKSSHANGEHIITAIESDGTVRVLRADRANHTASSYSSATIASHPEMLVKTGSAPAATEAPVQKSTPEITLPKGLASGKPRYSYGPKQFELHFASDLDKAAYIVAKADEKGGDSKAHVGYQAEALKSGLSVEQIIAHGAKVRDAIKALAKEGDPTKGPLTIPKQEVAGRATPRPSEPAAPLVAKPGDMPATQRADRQVGSGDANTPDWLKDNVKALAEPAEKSGLADKIEELAAQRQTAGQIAKALGTDPETVRAVRVSRGIPEWTLSTTHSGGGGENPEFTDWLAKRQGSVTPSNGNQPPVADEPAGDHHQQLADLINRGEASDHDDGKPSTTFAVLKRLKARGADITPELARNVSGQVEGICNDDSLDAPSKQTALRQLVQMHSQAASGDKEESPAAPDKSSAPSAPARRGSTQLTLSPTDAKPFQNFAGGIPDSLLYSEKHPETGAEKYGRETEPHITSLYGLHGSGDDAAAVAEAVKNHGPVTARLGKLSTFSNPDSPYDVVKAEVHGDDVHALNARLRGLEHSSDFPDYKPHLTLAYVKKGEGKRFEGRTTFEGKTVTFDRLTHSSADRVKTDLHLGNGADSLAVGDRIALNGSNAPVHTLTADDGGPKVELTGQDGKTVSVPREVALKRRSQRAALVGKDNSGIPGLEGQASGEPAKIDSPSLPTGERQPVTPQGKAAQRVLASLQRLRDAGVEFNGSQRHTQRTNELTLARDLNAQVLGPDAPPTSEEGKAAQGKLDRFAKEIPSMNAGQKLYVHGWQMAVEDDRTAQRKAIEAKNAPAPTVPAIGQNQTPISRNEPTGAASSTAVKPRIVAPAEPGGDSPAVATARNWLADQHAAGLSPSAHDIASTQKLPLATARQLMMDQADAENRAARTQPPAAPAAPAAPSTNTAAPFKRNQEVTYQGRPAVVEQSTPEKTVIRVKAGQDPKTGANLVAKRVTITDPSKLTAVQKPGKPTPRAPIKASDAEQTARTAITRGRQMLSGLGVERVNFGSTEAGSGVEFNENGTLHIDPAKLARAMEIVRDNQAELGIEGTSDDYFAQVLAHESIHGADAAVARAKGQTLQQRYDALPADALPDGWQKFGREAYGADNWDPLPEWKQKAEFVRQVVEGKWTGRITEALYNFIHEAVEFLKRVAGFEKADPRFRAHVEEVESRIAAASRQSEAPKADERVMHGRKAAIVQSVDGDTATIKYKGRSEPAVVPVSELKPKLQRSFQLAYGPGDVADVLDHIKAERGIRSPDGSPEYDCAPKLGGIYHQSVFNGRQTPDDMAKTLHENHGVGDGTPEKMWDEIGRAIQTRQTAREEAKRQALAEKQADRFDRDTQHPGKGRELINTSNLAIGDEVTVGDQTLKVIDINPDEDITLEDHSKYGVQRIEDGKALYVEKVESGEEGDSLAAPKPEPYGSRTRDLFAADDEPFSLRGEPAPEAMRIAAARARANAPAASGPKLPTLRPGEKGTADLFQGEDQPFNLAGETAIDHAARQAIAEQAEKTAAEARTKQDSEQSDLFTAHPTVEGPTSMGQVDAVGTKRFDPPATQPELLDAPTPEEKPATAIADFGEKIGGACKDTARPLGSRPKVGTPENADQPAWQRKYAVASELKRDYSTKTDRPTGKYVVLRTDGVRVPARPFDSADAAEAAIPLIEVGRNHAVSYTRKEGGALDWHIYRKVGEHKRPVVKGGFASEPEAKAYMATHPQEIIEHKFAFPERPWLDRLERTGGTARTGNVTPSMFQEAFGFRGGEFGNWNMGGDGQAALNHAFDALHDLSDILGISPKALSLNGDLAIAFGARGTGGVNAGSAHYEPGYQVINMTKIKGAGSLAHEWFHALDHYLGRQDGKATDRTKAEDAREASGRDLNYVRGEYASHGFSRQSGVREALRTAFKAVMDATVARPTELTIPAEKLANIQANQAQYVRDALNTIRQQFTTGHQYNRSKVPATPEQTAEFDRLADVIARGEVGERIHVKPQNAGRLSAWRDSYQPIEDLNALYKSVLGRSFATNDEHSQARKLFWQIGAMKDAQQRVANAGAKGGTETQTRNLATEFLKEARKIDQMRAGDYWSTAHEMGARSFESFVADKLAESSRRSDYLVHGTDNRAYALLGLKPYPEGDERATLNKAWQTVLDTIEEKPTDRGSALYAPQPKRIESSEPTPFHEAAPIIQRVAKERLAELKRAGEKPHSALGVAANTNLSRLSEKGQANFLRFADQADRAHNLGLATRGVTFRRAGGDSLAAPEPRPVGHQTSDPSRAASIKDLVDHALTPGSGGRKRYAALGTVSPEQASHMQSADMPLDLSGFQRNLDNFGVRHTWSEHGDPAAEKARGNLPIQREDFEKLPALLDHPTASLLAGQNSAGQDVILHAAKVNGHYIIAEEVRTGRKVLSVTTLFKRAASAVSQTHPPASGAAPEGTTPTPTSETLRSTALGMLRQIARQYNFRHGGGDSLAAAKPEPMDTAGLPPAAAEKPGALRTARALWKKHGTASPFFKRWFGDWQKEPATASKAVNAQGKPLVLFHGSPALTKGGFDTFEVPKHGGDLLAGSGIYLTDNRKLGQSYTLNRDELVSGGGAMVNHANVPESTPVIPLYAKIDKPFDAGTAGIDDARSIVAAELAKMPPEPPLKVGGKTIQPPSPQERATEAINNAARLYPDSDPLRAYKTLRDVLSQEGVIRNAQTAPGDELRGVLQAHGYDGITHEGGVMGGQKHNVWIAFEPAQVKSAEPAGSARSNSGEFDPRNGSTLAAPTPKPVAADDFEPVDPDEAATDTETATKKGSPLQWARDEIAGHVADHKLADTLSKDHDAADTMANVSGRHEQHSVELDFDRGQDRDSRHLAELDRRTAGPIFEAGGRRSELVADLEKVKASPDKKLAAKYAPFFHRALAKLDELHAKNAGARQTVLEQDAARERAGLAPDAEARMQHVHDDPLSPENTKFPDHGLRTVRGFKKVADAIAAGVDPKTTDIAEMIGRHVYRTQAAINEKAYHDKLAGMKASDGKPLLSSIEENTSALNPDGSVSSTVRVPHGYKAVQAGDNVLVAHKEIANLLQAQYGDDAFRSHWLGGAALDFAALIKHGAIGIDTFHGAQVAMRGLLGFGVADPRSALASLNYADKDLDRAAQQGRISQAQADEARESRRVDQLGLKYGVNVGKATDNLLEAAQHANLIEKIPGVGKVAKWTADKTFGVVQPAYITAAFRVAFARNTKSFPELSEAEVARRSTTEVNEFFGNVGTQGFLKSRTMRSVARVLLFAPGFVEGRFRTEFRGAAQAARTFADGVRGKGWRVGSVARSMGQILLASIIGAQALNLFTRGKPTWENDEEGHRWDAFIPGGKHGFFWSPLSLCAEFSHALLKYVEGGQSPLDALMHIGQNKLSGLSRAGLDLATGHDSLGRPFGSMAERLKAAALDASPLPMQAASLVKKDPKAPLGVTFGFDGGELEKTGFNAAGIRVDAGQSARAQMYQLAKPFRKDSGDQQPHAPSAYANLRRMLEDGDMDGARAEVRKLVSIGHQPDKIKSAFGIKAEGGVKTPLFTGSKDAEKKMLSKLTLGQRRTYFEALKEHARTAQTLKRVMGGGVPAAIAAGR